MQVLIELPDTPDVAALDRRYLNQAVIATLYYLGKVSEKEAREALGLSRRAFQEMLPRFGFSALADDDETVRTELSA